MDTSKGVFIVLEGADGSGKKTQCKLLAKRFAQAGYDVAVFDFPQYDQPSSYFVRQYLNSAYNNGGTPGPYTTSLFYALDRYEAAPNIRQALNEGKIVLANRYAGSNMAHQGTKLATPEERRGYFIWNDNLEFEMLRIPRPTISYILRVPARVAETLNRQSPPHRYLATPQDLHDSTPEHIRKTVDAYDELAQLLPKDFARIDCTRGGSLLPADTIHDILWQKIQPLLPEPSHKGKGRIEQASAASGQQEPLPVRQPTSTLEATTEPAVRKDEKGGYTITEIGKQLLATHVTSSTNPIYALTGKLAPELMAALVARFAVKPGDLRSTLLLEFAAANETDAALQAKSLAAYTQQPITRLAGAYVVLGDVSDLVAKTVAHTKSIVIIEQKPVLNSAAKDASGNYNYYVPGTLPADLAQAYRRSMDTLFDSYNQMVDTLAAYLDGNGAADAHATAARLCDVVLPVAAKSTTILYGSAEALEQYILTLLSSELNEARDTGMHMLAETRKVLPNLLATTDTSQHGGARIVHNASVRTALQTIAKEQLPDNHAPPSWPIQLAYVWPRNELDLLPDMIYPYTSQPLHSTAEEISKWSYGQKVSAYEAYLGKQQHKTHPGSALEKIRYTWDIVSDYTVFRELQQQIAIVQTQQLTPRYGYEVPALIEKAGLSDQFEACFDTSLALYSALQKADFTAEAQYAVLHGHKLRWTLTHTAYDAFQLLAAGTVQQLSPETRKLLSAILEKLSEVHPIIGESLHPAPKG